MSNTDAKRLMFEMLLCEIYNYTKEMQKKWHNNIFFSFIGIHSITITELGDSMMRDMVSCLVPLIFSTKKKGEKEKSAIVCLSVQVIFGFILFAKTELFRFLTSISLQLYSLCYGEWSRISEWFKSILMEPMQLQKHN